jgi:uncharacterized protein (TIGR00251 family)
VAVGCDSSHAETLTLIELTQSDGAIVFAVRVSPGAAKTRVAGEHDGALKVLVNAPPEKGKANKELIAFLAKTLGVKKSAVSLVSGETSRTKRIAVSTVAVGAFRDKLDALLSNA